jgi:hypothetical protein
MSKLEKLLTEHKGKIIVKLDQAGDLEFDVWSPMASFQKWRLFANAGEGVCRAMVSEWIRLCSAGKVDDFLDLVRQGGAGNPVFLTKQEMYLAKVNKLKEEIEKREQAFAKAMKLSEECSKLTGAGRTDAIRKQQEAATEYKEHSQHVDSMRCEFQETLVRGKKGKEVGSNEFNHLLKQFNWPPAEEDLLRPPLFSFLSLGGSRYFCLSIIQKGGTEGHAIGLHSSPTVAGLLDANLGWFEFRGIKGTFYLCKFLPEYLSIYYGDYLGGTFILTYYRSV